MDLPVYPIKFKPILKEKVWGGTKLKDLLNKNSTTNRIGESWEISDVENNASIVSNGILEGQNLSQLVASYQATLMGKSVFQNFGSKFPLLFKFIDANEDLSVQLHPDDQLAKARHNSFGKTEMWYIIQNDTDAQLVLGFNKKLSKKKFSEHLENGTIETLLNRKKIKKGDAFYITPGFVHAIGAGTLLAEIQQTSDITYRIYDWKRPDANGKLRELHTGLALDAIDFEIDSNQSILSNTSKEGLLVKSPYFSVCVFNTQEHKTRNVSNIDSFIVYMCVEGKTTISVNHNLETLALGETVLIPACAKEVHFQEDSAKVLEIFVP